MVWEALLCVSIKIVVLMSPSVRNRCCCGNPAIGAESMLKDRASWCTDSITKTSPNPLNVLQQVDIKGLMWSYHLCIFTTFIALWHEKHKCFSRITSLHWLPHPCLPDRIGGTCLPLSLPPCRVTPTFLPYKAKKQNVGNLDFICHFEDETLFFNLNIQCYILYFMTP